MNFIVKSSRVVDNESPELHEPTIKSSHEESLLNVQLQG